jgi:hypothetical protein
MSMAILRALLAKLFAALRPGRPAIARRQPIHRVIASYARRYPGRSSALELRQTLGWVAATTRHSHQDRRA